jgi:ElaB/YqjD/DUF883 family membrane-anchored ribosome-binding protein
METSTADCVYETKSEMIDTPALAVSRTSIFKLFKNFTGEFKTLVRQEIELAKKEISEKISMAGKNVASLAAGGFVAYAGLIVLLIGLGWLLGFAFQKAGLEPAFANFLGLAIIGLVIAMIGGVLIAKGLSSLKRNSMAPERTLHTLKELKGGKPVQTEIEKPDFSSEELEEQVQQTQYQMGATLDELGYRLSPRYINARIKSKVRENPYRAGLIAISVGLLGGLVLRKRFQRA